MGTGPSREKGEATETSRSMAGECTKTTAGQKKSRKHPPVPAALTETEAHLPGKCAACTISILFFAFFSIFFPFSLAFKNVLCYNINVSENVFIKTDSVSMAAMRATPDIVPET